jgi:hypothetical protein
VVEALAELGASASDQFSRRSEELAYLANVLVAGATIDGRRLRPIEAIEHVISVVSFGLELAVSEQGPPATAATLLRQFPADGLFRLALDRVQSPPKAQAPASTLAGHAGVSALLARLVV